MSGYHLCQVKKAVHPYYIESISTNIFTIEELCFYLQKNIYLIDETIMNEGLCDWIRDELGLGRLYRKLYEQLEKGELNPARIINHFTDPQQQRTAAQIFNTKIRAESQAEQEKAIRESIYKVVNHGITQKTKELGAADIQGLQKLIEARKRLQELGRLHISL